MGAGVAASPHGPLAAGYQAWEARQSAGRFRGRVRAGGSFAVSGGPCAACAPFRFPRRLPVRAEALAVRRSAVPEPGFRLPPSASRSRSSVSPPAGQLRPKPQPCPAAHRLASPACLSQLPGRSPVLPDAVRSRSSFLSPVAARRLSSRLLPDRSGPKSFPVFQVPHPGVWNPGRLNEACHFRIR